MKKILDGLKRDLNEKIDSIKRELEDIEENIEKLEKLRDVLSIRSLFAAEDFEPQKDKAIKKIFESLGYDINYVKFDNPEKLERDILDIKNEAVAKVSEIKKVVEMYEEKLSSIQDNIKYNNKSILDFVEENDPQSEQQRELK